MPSGSLEITWGAKERIIFQFFHEYLRTPLNLFVVPEASNIIRSNWDPAPSHPLPGLLRGVLRWQVLGPWTQEGAPKHAFASWKRSSGSPPPIFFCTALSCIPDKLARWLRYASFPLWTFKFTKWVNMRQATLLFLDQYSPYVPWAMKTIFFNHHLMSSTSKWAGSPGSQLRVYWAIPCHFHWGRVLIASQMWSRGLHLIWSSLVVLLNFAGYNVTICRNRAGSLAKNVNQVETEYTVPKDIWAWGGHQSQRV